MLPEVEFYDVSESFLKTRVIKEEFEIKKIKKACEIVDKIVYKIPELLNKGMFEYELAAEIDYMMQKHGADKPAFETISSFGKNTAEPHYSHGDTRLEKNDFVLCDFGACLKKYNSDITRTFIFGKANVKQKEMYNTVLEAQRVGLDKIKPGIKAHEVHDAVNTFIENSRFKGCFIHSTGHSLGLAVHDEGVGFTPDIDIILKEGMVLTVEPGVYIPGYGGVRIEDDVLIKKNGMDVLTKSSKKFIEV
jgi:Xaa-Pro dipeptidase